VPPGDRFIRRLGGLGQAAGEFGAGLRQIRLGRAPQLRRVGHEAGGEEQQEGEAVAVGQVADRGMQLARDGGTRGFAALGQQRVGQQAGTIERRGLRHRRRAGVLAAIAGG
jgi:hypothetical protein